VQILGLIWESLCQLLGKLLYLIYNTITFHNYGLALIVFTIVIKLALLPLNIKQYRSTAKLQEVQPKLQEIQKRYKNDKQKLQEETMKIYTEHGVNPAGGCLPMLVQMPIIFALFYVVRRPMYYVLGISKEKLGELFISLQSKESIVDLFKLKSALESVKIDKQPVFDVASMVKMVGDKIESIDLSGITDKFGLLFDAIIGRGDPYVEVNMLNYMNSNPSTIPDGMETINLTFLKIFNLGEVASWNPSVIMQNPGLYLPIFFLVVAAGAVTFISSKIMMSSNSNAASGNAQAAAMQKNMMLLGPLMTLWIGFSVPAGLALYWLVSNAAQLLQQMYINKYILKKDKK